MEEFEKTPCAICKSDDLFAYSSKGQFGLPTHVVICKHCGFSFLNPRWTNERYHEFYAKEYDKFYREETVNYPEAESEFKNIKVVLTRSEKFRISLNQPDAVLDIGCGMGHSLIFLKNNVYKSAGYYAIEPSENCNVHLRKNGISVITNDVFSNWETTIGKKFDLVIMRHVLEHFNDPIAVLKKVFSVLSDDGVLYLAVPDAKNPTRPLKSNYFRVVHVSYFSATSLNNALSLSSLEPLVLEEGDENEKFEIFAFCKKSSSVKSLMIDSAECEKQKNIYDEVGKSDFYYVQKSRLIRMLRKIKLLR